MAHPASEHVGRASRRPRPNRVTSEPAPTLTSTVEVPHISDGIAAAQRTGIPCQDLPRTKREDTSTGCSLTTTSGRLVQQPQPASKLAARGRDPLTCTPPVSETCSCRSIHSEDANSLPAFGNSEGLT
jgi:hypothetical protein